MTFEDIKALQSIGGTREKLNFIQNHSSDESFKSFLYYALNPLLTYNLSERTLRALRPEDFSAPMPMMFDSIFDMCEYLSRLRSMDNVTLRQVGSFLFSCNEQDREICIGLLSKSIRLGVTAKTVNKVIPDLIPEWEVQQAFPIEKGNIKPGAKFWLTQKLNGVRATYYNGRLIARSGFQYEGLDHIISALGTRELHGLVFDGELTLKNRDGLSDNEAFRISTGIINSDSEDKSEILYTVFDVIPVDEFESASPSLRYSSRRTMLDSMAEMFSSPDSPVRVLPALYAGRDKGVIEPMLEKMVAEDKEGLILNLDVPYRRMRHKGILKIKRFYTMDLPIVRCEEGTGRLAGTLGAFVLRYKDNEVKVGTGFTDEQRSEFWASRDDLVGAICEVKYKEISQDKQSGLDSLQFPVFVSIRTDKESVSYG